MAPADAQALVSDLIARGFDASASQIAPGAWAVYTRAPGLVDRPTVNGFAASHNATVGSYDVTTAVTFR